MPTIIERTAPLIINLPEQKLSVDAIRNIAVRFANIAEKEGLPGFHYNELLNALADAIQEALVGLGIPYTESASGAFPEWSRARTKAGFSKRGAGLEDGKEEMSLDELNLLTLALADIIATHKIEGVSLNSFLTRLRLVLFFDPLCFMSIDVSSFRPKVDRGLVHKVEDLLLNEPHTDWTHVRTQCSKVQR